MPEHAYTQTVVDLPDPWASRACNGMDTEKFFRPQGSQETADAKEICAGCPVRTMCLERALEYPETEDHGVLGGLDEWERKRLRKLSA